jgi:hypothetical protein
MKKPLTLILLALSICCCAQEVKVPDFALPRSVVKFSPQHLIKNTLDLSIERFDSSFSKSFQLSTGIKWGARNYQNGKGAHLELAYRNYLSPMKLHSNRGHGYYQGIYYSLFLNGAYFSGTALDFSYAPDTGEVFENYELKISSLAPGFTLGLQVTEWKAIVFDVFAGGGFRFVQLNDNGMMQSNIRTFQSDQSDPAYDGIFIKAGLKIGVGL